ncbi:hypothetical protein TNCV_2576861 [Trichonephila clavipes]|nr:hypothetical protein TNCV_2576861 [Trichonephila clavipes]
MVLERPLLVVWILNQSLTAASVKEGRAGVNLPLRWRVDGPIEQKSSFPMWLRSCRSKHLFANEYFLPGNGAQRNLIFQIASVFKMHQISHSIFEVGGEAIPVMTVREKKENPETTILLVPHRGRCLGTRGGSVTNGKRNVLELPVWILNQSLTAASVKEGRARLPSGQTKSMKSLTLTESDTRSGLSCRSSQFSPRCTEVKPVLPGI